MNQRDSSVELAIVIGGDVGDEISRVGLANGFFADLQSWHCLSNERGDLLRVAGLPDFAEKRNRFFDRCHSPSERSFHPPRVECRVFWTWRLEMRISESRRLNQFFVELQFPCKQLRKLELAHRARAGDVI